MSMVENEPLTRVSCLPELYSNLSQLYDVPVPNYAPIQQVIIINHRNAKPLQTEFQQKGGNVDFNFYKDIVSFMGISFDEYHWRQNLITLELRSQNEVYTISTLHEFLHYQYYQKGGTHPDCDREKEARELFDTLRSNGVINELNKQMVESKSV